MLQHSGSRRSVYGTAFIGSGTPSGFTALKPRVIRQVEVDGLRPLSLEVNGERMATVYPGANTLEPPVAVKPGDFITFSHDDGSLS